MKRVFVFQDFKSQKFWSIDAQGNSLILNYGKLGADGQTHVKTFKSLEETEKAATKLIAEKLKKGYVETEDEIVKTMKAQAKKYKLSYDEYDNGKTQKDLLLKIVNDKKLSDIRQIAIGCWDFESGDCQELVDGLVANKEKVAHLEGLFWGDIDSEETEISWIEQTDLSPLLDCMPNLQELVIKGTNNLKIGQRTRPNLKSLEIISGGLPCEVVEDIVKSDFPNLEKLLLYIGVDEYGFDGTPEQFKPLLSKAKFPKLTYMGLVNAEEQDEFVELLLESDILPQLEIMDISCGVLSDEGAQLLLDNVDKIKHLKFINMRYNYLTDGMKKQLAKLPVKIDVAESEEIDDDFGGYPMITE